MTQRDTIRTQDRTISAKFIDKKLMARIKKACKIAGTGEPLFFAAAAEMFVAELEKLTASPATVIQFPKRKTA